MSVSCATLQVHLYIFVCLNLTWDSIRNQSARCGLHEARTRSAWGRKKEKKNPLFQFLFPLLSCVTRPKLVRGPPVKPVYASFKPSDVSRYVLRHWNLSREEAVLSTVYFSARIEGLILWKNSLCNHRFSRYHFQRHYFYSHRNAL